MPHLKKLDLSENLNIGQGGAVQLMTSLIAHNSLEELSLDNTGIGTEDCRPLSKLLSSSTTSIKKLKINHNDLPLDAVELIISGLQYNTTLEVLDMRKCSFSHQNTMSLALALRENHTLVHLSLYECNIGPDGACQLASALSTNDTLRELNLGENSIRAEGATAFAVMLRKSKSLKKLFLRDTFIGEDGTQKLIDSLTHNTTLEELVLPMMYNSYNCEVDRRVRYL